jgi:hypothetical protein
MRRQGSKSHDHQMQSLHTESNLNELMKQGFNHLFSFTLLEVELH